MRERFGLGDALLLDVRMGCWYLKGYLVEMFGSVGPENLEACRKKEALNDFS